VRDWLSPDGTARVKALPKGDPNDTNVLRGFATAVLRAEPSATGGAVSLYESARTVTEAFIQAGILAIAAITILLFIALRRVTDVLMTLVPLLLAGVVTLEICVLDGLSLNFANIIALPLLLGVGVAFKIYYIMAWRAGKTGLLQSTLTRAVIFSAMTTGTAFGKHVGVEQSRHVEHGQADGACTAMHDGLCSAVPASSHGAAAASKDIF
jgi:predicted RND superfamily exporter protein